VLSGLLADASSIGSYVTWYDMAYVKWRFGKKWKWSGRDLFSVPWRHFLGRTRENPKNSDYKVFRLRFEPGDFRNQYDFHFSAPCIDVISLNRVAFGDGSCRRVTIYMQILSFLKKDVGHYSPGRQEMN